MLESGIELYELRPDAASCQRLVGTAARRSGDAKLGLHAKSVIFDRAKVFVGSFNLNPRSVYRNCEVGLLVHSSELARRIAAVIEENMRPENSWRVALDDDGRIYWTGGESGSEVRYSTEPETGLGRRFKSGLFWMLPIEKYL